MENILKDLGWGDGFRIPVANEENRALQLEFEKKQKEKENLRSALEDITERVTGMKKHLENVHYQLAENQNLIYAHSNQKAAEENMTKLAKAEDNSLMQEIKKFKKEESAVQDRMSNVQTDIDRCLQHIERLNATIKWDKNALLAWDEEVSKGEDDAHMLEKFRTEDEAKFRELELKRQCLGLDVENKKNRLINLKNDIASLEQALDKTGQMFRRQHIDRRTLVQQWEGSVRVLHQRNDDIRGIVEEIVNLKCLAKEKVLNLEEAKMYFEDQVKNKKELEREIEILSKEVSEGKEKIRMFEGIVTEESDKLILMKKVLESTTSEYMKEMRRKKSLICSIEEKEKQAINLTAKLEKIKEEYQKCKNKKVSAGERVKKLEDLLKEEEKSIEKNHLEFTKLNDLLFQVTQESNDLKDGEKTQVNKVKHMDNCRTSVNKDLVKAQCELTKQKQVLYNMDFSYMEKDILLNRMLGMKRDKDEEKYEKRISELEKVHTELTSRNNMLTKEVRRLEEDMRKITIDIQGDTKEEQYLKSKRQENLMTVEGGQKQLEELRNRNQNRQVDENLLKLRVKQAESAIDVVGGKLYCLEKQRLELEEVIKEREVEIRTLRDVLNVRKRVLTEQASGLNSRINLAKLKVEHLKSKYYVEIVKLGQNEDGEPMSVGQMKVKAVQEKFELQELGDALDSKIKKTEKEIEAMENTLKVVKASNQAFKNNLQNVDSQSPEQMEKEKLEKTHCDLMSNCRKQKAVLESLLVITMDLEEEYREKVRMEEAIKKTWKEKDEQMAEINKELREQEEKLERAKKQLKKLIKDIRGTKIEKFQTIEEKDIELRELMDQNEYGLQQLAELVAKTYDMSPVVLRYLAEKGMSLPTMKTPAPSLRCSSTASLPSARSSVSSKSTKSSDSVASRSSGCVCATAVVTLDSTRLGEKSETSASKKESFRKKEESDSKKKDFK